MEEEPRHRIMVGHGAIRAKQKNEQPTRAKSCRQVIEHDAGDGSGLTRTGLRSIVRLQ